MVLFLMVFLISVFIAFLLLVAHSLIYRGIRETLIFFGYGFLFGLIREFIFKYYIHNYSFGNMPLQLFGVPIAIIFGWMFTFYIGYSLCERFLKSEEESEYMRLIVLCAIFSSSICVAIETTAIHMNWWDLYHLPTAYSPLELIGGWFATALLFFGFYFVIQGKIKSIKNVVMPVFLIILIAIIEFMALSNLLIMIIFFLSLIGFLLIYPYLITILVSLFVITFNYTDQTNDLWLLIFFIIEFAYLFLVLKLPEMFKTSIIK